MKNKVLKTIVLGNIVLTTLFIPTYVLGEDLDQEIANQVEKIKTLDEQTMDTNRELSMIKDNISAIMVEAEALQEQKATLQSEVQQLDQEIDVLMSKIEKRQQTIEQQARSVQLEGENSNIVDVILGAESFSDAFTKVVAASRIVGANNTLLKQQRDDQQALIDKQAETDMKLEQAKEMAVSLELKKAELLDQELFHEVTLSNLTIEKETASAKKQELIEDKKAVEAEIEAHKKALELATRQNNKEKEANSVVPATETSSKESTEKVEEDVKIEELVSIEGVKEEAEEVSVVSLQDVPTLNEEKLTQESEELVEDSQSVEEETEETQNEQSTEESKVDQTTTQESEPTEESVHQADPPVVSHGSAVVSEAYKHIGKPYVWGSRGPDSFDCSGFTSYVYRQAVGIEIGGWTVPQESAGTYISLSELQAGDLVFWGSRGSTYHVGIYVGNGQYIHAPQPGETVTVASMSSYTPTFGVRVN